ncbi:hypothetical protein KGM_213811B, partial [Danaus plexippus plexippus]
LYSNLVAPRWRCTLVAEIAPSPDTPPPGASALPPPPALSPRALNTPRTRKLG